MKTGKNKISNVTTQPTLYGRGNLKVCRRGRDASILLVSLFRPDVMNAFSDDLYLDLVDVLRESSQEDSIAAIVLTGCGSYFSSGADLRGRAASFDPEPEGRRTIHKPAGQFMMALLGYPKIIAAAVQGPAVGIGVTLLMHCDIVHCAPEATFWAPFTRLALVPELCSSVTFVESMGLSKANELLLFSRKIDAETAVAWNMASRVVTGCEVMSGDPFHPKSLATTLCSELDRRLLALPQGSNTANMFVKLTKGTRRQRLEQICREELLELDRRFDSGQVMEAASQIQFGSSKKNPSRSKL